MENPAQPRAANVIERVLELSSNHAPWHRRLWRCGTIQLGRELLDQSSRPGVPAHAVDVLRNHFVHAVNTDPSLRGSTEGLVKAAKKVPQGASPMGHQWTQLSVALDKADDSYFAQWSSLVRADGNFDAEGAARRLAAHLFETGFHRSSVHSWLGRYQKQSESDKKAALIGFLDEADERQRKPLHIYQFCVPVVVPPEVESGAPLPDGWLDGPATARWRKEHAPLAAPQRQQGSFLLSTEARDINAAAEQIRTSIQNLLNRISLGVRREIKVAAEMWSREKKTPFPTQSTNRSVALKSFRARGRLYELEEPPYVASALALLAPMRSGAAHEAIVNGWAAVESLLVGENDQYHDVAAARFSQIIAASLPRAELTYLGRKYANENEDDLAAAIRLCSRNIDCAHLMQQRILYGDAIEFKERRHALAVSRIRPLLENPMKEFVKLEKILEREFRRTYRTRNSILHAGHTDSNMIPPLADMMAPLVGAGVDRITNVALLYQRSPLALSGTIEARMADLEKPKEHEIGTLLNLLEFR